MSGEKAPTRIARVQMVGALLLIVPAFVAWIPYLRRLYASGTLDEQVRQAGRQASLLPLMITVMVGIVACIVAFLLPVGAWTPWLIAIPVMACATWVTARMSMAAKRVGLD
ncbi:hypothetical protein ASE14_15300 [Agromyces sp. Root81]|nr:hypothetical protein ASE14_15300 [Agromyces sp. Root81]